MISGSPATLRQYHLTGKGLEILSRFVSALDGERVSAWSLIGPYGMGKSSFANYLLALCGPASGQEAKTALQMLEEKDIDLARTLLILLNKHSAREKGLFRVAATASFESINRTLASGLRRTLLKTEYWPRRHRQELSQLILKLDELLAHPMPETTHLVKLFKTAGEIYGAPVLVMIDEFGKNLEYMARFPAQGDLFVLQSLAESPNTYIWVCLHQAFEEYASRLSGRQLQEWGKIHGRFEEISFVEPRNEMIRFICETLTRKNDNPLLDQAVRSWAKHFHTQAKQLDIPEIKNLRLETIERFYPLNPLAAVLLPELCIRFAQNDRTLFAFLCGGEPNALPAFLASRSIDLESGRIATFGPELLYDYFLSSTSTALMNRPESHRWVEIHDIIERSRSIDPFHLGVLKVIGLLNLISGPSRFRSSDKLVSFAFLKPHPNPGEAERNLQEAIDENIQKGILIYREYADEYRLWEGTDFDIPAAIREHKALLATQPLEQVIRDTLPQFVDLEHQNPLITDEAGSQVEYQRIGQYAILPGIYASLTVRVQDRTGTITAEPVKH